MVGDFVFGFAVGFVATGLLLRGLLRATFRALRMASHLHADAERLSASWQELRAEADDQLMNVQGILDRTKVIQDALVEERKEKSDE